jgi:hypothetical protein
MMLKVNEVLPAGTRVRALTNRSHDLVIAGESVGIILCYCESIELYKVRYSVMDRRTHGLPTAKFVKAHEYRHEFEVLDNTDSGTLY